jgi:ABC-type nitrate/sulfonate/bicarbonate transport system substrate-binding protein
VKEQRMLDRKGYLVDLQVYERNTDMVNDFTSGRLDVTSQSSLTLFPLEARYPNRFKFIYGQNNQSYSFIVPTSSSLQSLRDLADKTVVTWTSPTAYLSIRLVLKPLVADLRRVNIAGVQISDLNQMLADNKVDAAFSTDVFIARAIRKGWARYLSKDPLKDNVANPFFSGGGFVSPALIGSEPQVAADIQSAFEEAIDFIEKSPADARSLLPAYIKTIELEDALAAPIDEFVPVNRIDIDRAQRLADRLYDEGELERRIDVQPLFFRRAK